MQDQTEARVARNDAAFRTAGVRAAANESLLRRPFVCECGEEACATIVLLTRAEYEAVRAEPTCFILASSHTDTAALVVVRREPQYLVVEQPVVQH